MKKLMFVAAAALSATVFADTGITSDIVGYQNKGVDKGLSFQIPTFEIIGSEGSDITAFKPVDENGDPLSGEITFQWYGANGKLDESKQYTWWLGEDIDEGYEDGWYDGNQDEVKDITLGAGEGFVIYTTYTGAYLKFPSL